MAVQSAEVLITLTGVTAIWLSQDRRYNVRRWASVVGLVGQPAWFYLMWTSELYLMFFLCFLYTASWLKGFYNYWVKDWLTGRRCYGKESD